MIFYIMAKSEELEAIKSEPESKPESESEPELELESKQESIETIAERVQTNTPDLESKVSAK